MTSTMENQEIKFVGTFELGNKVDITAPCYNKDVWCRITTDCTPGKYYAYALLKDEGEWGMRVASLAIYLDNEIVSNPKWEYIGEIGVDAGMAGFFRDKPDYDDDAWSDFCNQIGNKDFVELGYGVVSSSGYGDGSYNVYTNKNSSAFMIQFL